MCPCIDVRMWWLRFFFLEILKTEMIESWGISNFNLWKKWYNIMDVIILCFHQHHKFVPHFHIYCYLFSWQQIFLLVKEDTQRNFDFNFLHGYVSWNCHLLQELYVQLIILCIIFLFLWWYHCLIFLLFAWF